MTAYHLKEGNVDTVEEWLVDFFEQGYTDTRHFYARRATKDISLRPMIVGEALSKLEDDAPPGFSIQRDESRNSSPERWIVEKIE